MRNASSPMSGSSSAGCPASAQCSIRPMASTSSRAASRSACSCSASTLVRLRDPGLQRVLAHAGCAASATSKPSSCTPPCSPSSTMNGCRSRWATPPSWAKAKPRRASTNSVDTSCAPRPWRLQPLCQRVGAFGVVEHEGPVFAHADLQRFGQVRMPAACAARRTACPSAAGLRPPGGCARGSSSSPSRPFDALRVSITRQAMLRWLLPASDSSLKWPRRRPTGTSVPAMRVGVGVSDGFKT